MTGAGSVHRLDLRVARDDVIHFLEYPDGRQPPERVERILGEVLPEARSLAAARGTFVHLPVERAAEVGLEPIDADALVVGLVTAGPALEARARELLAGDEMTRGLLLDAAGSAAAEEAADRLGAIVVRDDRCGDAAAISCRLSPGYGGWKLESQPALFSLLPHDAVGVTLTASLMMVPRKSISFAMWLGARGRIGKGLSGCIRCTLEHCRYRRAPKDPTSAPASPSPPVSRSMP